MINVRCNIPVQNKIEIGNAHLMKNSKYIRSLYIYYIYTFLKDKMCIGVSFAVIKNSD